MFSSQLSSYYQKIIIHFCVGSGQLDLLIQVWVLQFCHIIQDKFHDAVFKITHMGVYETCRKDELAAFFLQVLC